MPRSHLLCPGDEKDGAWLLLRNLERPPMRSQTGSGDGGWKRCGEHRSVDVSTAGCHRYREMI